MSVKVNWEKQPGRNLFFSDLHVNQCFRNVNGRGAVYRKIITNSDVFGQLKHLMMEEATGRVFNPTTSQVELVEVEVTVKASKPYIYN